MHRKMAFLTVVFFAVCVPLFAQQTEPATPAEPVQVQPAQPAAAEPGATPAMDSAMRLYRQRRYAAAIAEFEQIVAADPNNAAAHYFMGYAHYVMRHFDEAQAAFAKAFAANPAFDPRPFFR